MPFEYFLSEKERLVVLSLQGDLQERDNELLDECLERALNAKPAAVAIHLAQVTEIQKGALRGVVLLLRGLKSKGIHVLAAGLQDLPKKSLVQGGILTAAECRDSLPEALKDLSLLVRNSKLQASG